MKRKFKTYLLGILTIFILCLTNNNLYGQKAPNIKKIEAEQYERSYFKWKKDQPKKRIEEAKYGVSRKKESGRNNKNNKKLNKRILAIKARNKE